MSTVRILPGTLPAVPQPARYTLHGHAVTEMRAARSGLPGIVAVDTACGMVLPGEPLTWAAPTCEGCDTRKASRAAAMLRHPAGKGRR